ncbi:hypothetical protein UFOVP760_207 [uncultured Caudovirales phage]|uniref:Uncharacterized protein n=1 Tax=uncultured Caudovirales phage TaxID=2100421 RepID=A0A6J7X6C7_9CAUD|nr:hypothetical protein UFOVP760_207 [uncultured Caudovirales phage]
MGEINENDRFGSTIVSTVKKYNLQKVLEIGSWDGTGSTQCFIKGMMELEEPSLTCIEVKNDRYKQLVENTKKYPWVKCVNQTTISLKTLIDNDFEALWDGPYNHIKSDKQTVNDWYNQDIGEISKYDTGFLETDNAYYDGILIDGSEFFGYSEYLLVKDRCRVLFLDDYYNAFKTRRVVEELSKDERWQCVDGDRYTRNGFAIFVKK